MRAGVRTVKVSHILLEKFLLGELRPADSNLPKDAKIILSSWDPPGVITLLVESEEWPVTHETQEFEVQHTVIT